jgi:hypothetical protein
VVAAGLEVQEVQADRTVETAGHVQADRARIGAAPGRAVIVGHARVAIVDLVLAETGGLDPVEIADRARAAGATNARTGEDRGAMSLNFSRSSPRQ